MPRIRSLYPSFWSDEKVGELPFGGRLLFQGLWTFADDAGRIQDNAKQFKALIFPYDNLLASEINTWLTQLASLGLIQRYSVANKKYIQITTFSHYQHPKYPTPSTIPSPSIPPAFPQPYPSPTPALTHVVVDEGGGVDELSKDKSTPPPTTPSQGAQDLNFSQMMKNYEQVFGFISPIIADEIQAFWDSKPPQLSPGAWLGWWLETFKIAVSRNHRSWAYVRAILKRCTAEGKPPQDSPPVGAGRQPKPAPTGPSIRDLATKVPLPKDNPYRKGKYGHVVQE